MDPLKIFYVGPTEDISGYANAARQYIKALVHAGHDVTVRPFACDSYHYPTTPEDEERKKLRHFEYDVLIEHCTPEFHGKFLPTGISWKKRVSLFVWETSRILWRTWVENLNKVDAIIVPCAQNIFSLRASNVKPPIHILPHCFDTSVYDKQYPRVDFGVPEDTVNFYSIFQWCTKKAPEVLIRTFTAAFADFTSVDQVTLNIRSYQDPFRRVDESAALKAEMERIRKSISIIRAPQINVLTSYLSDEEIYALHQQMDYFVLPTRGEAWCIPAFDAMAFGSAPIVTNYAGVREYLDDNVGFPVGYDPSPCFGMGNPNLYTGYETWAEPLQSELIANMRLAYKIKREEPDILNKMGKAGRERAEQFSIENCNWDKVLGDVLDGAPGESPSI